MGKRDEHSTVLGLALLAWLVIILLISPQECFVSTALIDTELYERTEYGRVVRLRMNLGQEEHLNKFPLRIGEWDGFDYDMSGLEKYYHLGADAILMRTYTKARLSQPVFLLLMQSSRTSSFHPPPVCYSVLGYEIEKGKDWVYVADESWSERTSEKELSKLPKPIREEMGYLPFTGWVAVNKLVLFKQNDKGEVTERRVVLYFYIGDIASGKIGMVRGSALAPSSGPYDDALSAVKEFMGEAIPLMFEPGKEGKMFITCLTELGILGYFVILLLFFIPLAVIFYPKVMAWRNKPGSSREI